MEPPKLTAGPLLLILSLALLQTPTEVPAWVQRGTYIENGITYLVAQTERPFEKQVQADAALDDVIRNTVQHYLEQQAGRTLPRLEISETEIQTRLVVPNTRVVKQFEVKYDPEIVQRFGGVDHDTYQRAFAQIKLDADFLASARKTLHRQSVRQRLQWSALGGFGLLASLCVLFGYLRINHATRGYYNRRLQTAAILSAIAIAASLFWSLKFLQG